jgi:hypothetical protein
MTVGVLLRLKPLALSFTALSLGLCGCSTTPSFSTWRRAETQASVSGERPPFVQNCAIVTISSPTRYECNGKIYTSFELAKLRTDWEAKDQAGSKTIPGVSTKANN